MEQIKPKIPESFTNHPSISKPSLSYDFHPQNYELSSFETLSSSIPDEFSHNKGLLLKNPSFFTSDYYNFLILFLIYMTIGLTIGFFEESLTVILTKAGASYSQLSLISLVSYPFSLKFLWAPLCDSFYLKNPSLGKRKTYIVIPCYLTGFIMFLTAFWVNSWVLELKAWIFTIIGFFIEIFSAFITIGADAWSIAILKPENIAFAAMALSIGEDFGLILSYNVFIWLNVRGGDTAISTINNSIISSKTWFFVMAFLMIFTAFLVQFFKKEKKADNGDFEGISKVFKELKGFFLNENLRFLMFVFVFAQVSFAIVDDSGYIILIEKGFSTDLIDTFDFISTFIGFLGYFIAAFYIKRRKEWTLYLICIVIRLFLDIWLYFIVVFYDTETNDTLMTILYGFQVNLYTIIVDCYGMATYSFILRISQVNGRISASFITVLACVSNFGDSWTYTAALWLLDYFSFENLAVCSWGFALLFFGIFGKKIREMEQLGEEKWNLAFIG